jgi:hypothetical protein
MTNTTTDKLAEALRTARESAAYDNGEERVILQAGAAWMAASHDALAEYDAQRVAKPTNAAPVAALVDALESLREFAWNALDGSIHHDNLEFFAKKADDAVAEYRAQRARAPSPAPGSRIYNGRVYTPLEMATAERGTDAWLAAGSQGAPAGEHTAEPWRYEQAWEKEIQLFGSESNDANKIASLLVSMGGGDYLHNAATAAANARRIAACVNACAGMDIASLERDNLWELLMACEQMMIGFEDDDEQGNGDVVRPILARVRAFIGTTEAA